MGEKNTSPENTTIRHEAKNVTKNNSDPATTQPPDTPTPDTDTAPLTGARRILILAAFAFIGGTFIGLLAGLLSLLLSEIQNLAWGYGEDAGNPGPADVPHWRLTAALLTAALLTAITWWILRERHTPVPSVARAVKGEKMPLIPTIIHVILQIVIVGAGLSIGRETAPRELGALAGQRYAHATKLSDEDARLVTAVAAGAGFAGVYNSPLAGMFFAVEMLIVSARWDVTILALTTCCMSAFTAGLIKGTDPFYVLPGMTDRQTVGELTVTGGTILFAILTAPLWGALGALFLRGNQRAGARHARGATILWMLPLAALITAGIAIVFPQVCGNGRAAAQLAFNAATTAENKGPAYAAGFLVALAALKAAATLLTIRSGASGGVITPAIAIGACCAAALGLGWVRIIPGDSVAVCALIGAAAVLASSQQAPLMASCLMLELTHLPMTFALPVGLSCALSVAVARLILRRLPVVTQLPARAHVPRGAQSDVKRRAAR